jgi:hypothetical protein
METEIGGNHVYPQAVRSEDAWGEDNDPGDGNSQ